jgi:UDP-N-acetylglucosamine/UDP-N-acetylgalactosamine diphosphorylase
MSAVDHEGDPAAKKSKASSSLEARLRESGQEHIIAMLPHAVHDQTHAVHKQLAAIDIPQVLRDLKQSLDAGDSLSDAVAPVSLVTNWNSLESTSKQELLDIGYGAIRSSSVCAVILSGGQGTRLGYDGPKGMYELGMPSGRCIFQYHMDRLSRIKTLSGAASIPVYIMTSDLNDGVIREYFKSKNYFGYRSSDVFFFEQSLLPCLTTDGKIIVESETSISRAPCGNGGIYAALESSGAIDDMASRGVHHLHVFGIDNILTKAVDPAFIGLCVKNKAECGNKVVWRGSKSEKVGVTAVRDGRLTVVEYSDLPLSMGEMEDDKGRLVYGAANICNHYFSLDFIRSKVLGNSSLAYHVAHKKIPFFDKESHSTITPSAVNGVKLELFIFDVFPLADSWVVMEVSREDEFAPVKNAPNSGSDSPDTARALLSAQAKRWLARVGCTFEEGTEDALCEISSTLSYDGEGLEAWKNKVVKLPCFFDAW